MIMIALRNQQGQGIAEYTIIGTLIAVVAMVAFTYLGAGSLQNLNLGVSSF